MTTKHDGLRLSLQLHTRLHKLEQERRQQNANKMEAYTQQVALEQLKDENKDKARLAQKLAELEVLSPSFTRYYAFASHIQLVHKPNNDLFEQVCQVSLRLPLGSCSMATS
jgi:hypothetical protein